MCNNLEKCVTTWKMCNNLEKLEKKVGKKLEKSWKKVGKNMEMRRKKITTKQSELSLCTFRTANGTVGTTPSFLMAFWGLIN